MIKNGYDGLRVGQNFLGHAQCRPKVVVRGGTISENSRHGVSAIMGGMVTVAKAEEDSLPQLVCKDNGQLQERHDRQTGGGGKIIGIPAEKIHHVA